MQRRSQLPPLRKIARGFCFNVALSQDLALRTLELSRLIRQDRAGVASVFREVQSAALRRSESTFSATRIQGLWSLSDLFKCSSE